MIDRDVLVPVAKARGRVRLTDGATVVLVGVRQTFARFRAVKPGPNGVRREWTGRRSEIHSILPPDVDVATRGTVTVSDQPGRNP